MNYGYANLGTSPTPINGAQLLNGTQSATLSGDVDGGGNITNGDVTFPGTVFPGAAINPALGPNSTLTLGFNEAAPLTGTTTGAGGQLALIGTYVASVTLANNAINPVLDGTCNYTLSDVTTAGNPITLSTETTTPYHGRRFVGGGSGSISGTGKLRTTGAPDATTCGLLDTALNNINVDLWLGRNSIPSEGVPWIQSLEYGRLNVGIATNLDLITPDNGPARYIGLISGDAPAAVTDPTPTTAGLAVPGGVPGSATAPGFHFTHIDGTLQGIPVGTDLELLTPGAAGAFDTASGVMTLDGNYKSTVTLGSPPTDTCTSQPDPLELSTAKNNGSPFVSDPLSGQPFAGLGGPGAVADNWASLPAAPEGGNCNTLNAVAFSQPGGLWMSHGIAPPAPPSSGGGTTTTTTPPPTGNPAALKKCIKKAKKKFKHNAKKRKKAIKKCKKKFG